MVILPVALFFVCLVVLNVVLRYAIKKWMAHWSAHKVWNKDGIMPDAEPFTCGSGNTAILFIHGFNDVPAVWRLMISRIAAHGFICRAMRLPGCGERGCPYVSLSTFQHDITNEITALHGSARRVFIVAHSLGGALAIDALRRHYLTQFQIAGAVLLAPLVRVSGKRCPLLPATAWYHIAKLFFPFIVLFPSIFSERLRSPLHGEPAEYYNRDKFNHVSMYDAMFRIMRLNRSTDVFAVTTPILAILAGDDRVVDTHASAAWLAKYTGPCRIETIAGASHVLPLEDDWEKTADTVVDFVSDICYNAERG